MTTATAGRINLFHILASDNATLFHAADNGTNKSALLQTIYNKTYTYNFKLTVNGEFDMGIFAAGNALTKKCNSTKFILFKL